jgi:predicted nuclease of predicted toxin-antitoxin system
MLRLAADENFNADIVRGLRRRFQNLDLVRVQDVGLSGADDPTVLAWAAREHRVLLTHDVATLVGVALDRVTDGKAMPGVVAVPSRRPSDLPPL